MLAPLRAEPETARGEIGLEDRLEHDLHRGLHDAVANRGNRQRPLLGRSRLGDIHPPRRKRPIRPIPQFAGQLIKEPVDAVLLLDPVQGGPVDARCAIVGAHRDPRAPQDISAQDLVPQRMKPSPGIGLGRPVQRVLQGTHLIHRNLVFDKGSAVGGTSLTGTHRAPPLSPTRIDEVVALPSPAVVLSARLNRYYGHLRRPSGWLPLPGSSPVIGHRAPTASRSRSGRGGPLQFPPPLSERSEPLTPGSPSRLHFQDLHRFHGLRPVLPGSALPRPTRHRAGDLTTRQASLDVTDRSVAHPVNQGARRWASTPPVSRRHRQPATGPPDSYPDRTFTGKRRRAYESAVNHSHDQPPFTTGRTRKAT